jgi:hypothetical protein
MTIERKTVIDSIQIMRDGSVQLRIGLLLVEDGAELYTAWHRATVAPDGNLDATIAAVESALQAKGHPAIESAGKARLVAVRAAARR